MDKYPLLGGQLHWAGQNPESLLEKAESWLIIVFCFRSLFFSDDIDFFDKVGYSKHDQQGSNRFWVDHMRHQFH